MLKRYTLPEVENPTRPQQVATKDYVDTLSGHPSFFGSQLPDVANSLLTYIPISAYGLAFSTNTESLVQTNNLLPYTIKKLTALVISNTLNGVASISLQVDGVAAAEIVMLAGTTGNLTTGEITVLVPANSLHNFKLDTVDATSGLISLSVYAEII